MYFINTYPTVVVIKCIQQINAIEVSCPVEVLNLNTNDESVTFTWSVINHTLRYHRFNFWRRFQRHNLPCNNKQDVVVSKNAGGLTKEFAKSKSSDVTDSNTVTVRDLIKRKSSKTWVDKVQVLILPGGGGGEEEEEP